MIILNIFRFLKKFQNSIERGLSILKHKNWGILFINSTDLRTFVTIWSWIIYIFKIRSFSMSRSSILIYLINIKNYWEQFLALTLHIIYDLFILEIIRKPHIVLWYDDLFLGIRIRVCKINIWLLEYIFLFSFILRVNLNIFGRFFIYFVLLTHH